MKKIFRIFLLFLLLIFIFLSNSMIISEKDKKNQNIIQSEQTEYIAVNIAELYYLSKTDKDYTEKKYMVRGVVFRNEKFASGTFGLLRFMIVCCYADAVPMLLPIEADNADSFDTKSWVNVYGSFRKDILEKKDNKFIFSAEKIEYIETDKVTPGRYLYI